MPRPSALDLTPSKSDITDVVGSFFFFLTSIACIQLKAEASPVFLLPPSCSDPGGEKIKEANKLDKERLPNLDMTALPSAPALITY